MKRLLIVLWFLPVLSCQEGNQKMEVGAIGKEAMIVTAHPLATKAGLETLRIGGNAFDATVTIHFMLAVVYPRAGNIGGGGFAVVREHDGTISSLDFREKAPLKAFETMYQNETGEVIEEKSRLGHLATGVPGSVAGIWELHQTLGSLKWTDLLQPAIDMAFDGFEITEDEAITLNSKQQDFIDANLHKPWPIKQNPWIAGDRIVQKQLAATLSFIRDQGRDGFYKGIVAKHIEEEMKEGGGIISLQDLESYEPKWRSPIVGSYKGYNIISMSPPSSGGVALMQLLQGAEQMKLGELPHNSTEAVHLMAELERLVFADRATYLGDPDFVEVPSQDLLDSSYNASRFDMINLTKARPSEEVFAGKFTMAESWETTHYSVIDPFGNALSLTTTLNGNYGSKVMVDGAGFFLNNEMDDFSSKPGTPDMFGLITGKRNAIAPGKRMISAMTPTILEKDGQLKMVLGSPGGPTIITSVFQTIINVIDHSMSMQQAVSSKKIHHQWQPDRILVEDEALSNHQLDDLRKMGHRIEMRNKIGRTDCILVLQDGRLEGGADFTRGDDYAEGF